MCQEKKEEEDLPVLKTLLTHQYNDSKTDYSNQKQYGPHEDEENDNNHKTKMGRKSLYGRFKFKISNISNEKSWM